MKGRHCLFKVIILSLSCVSNHAETRVVAWGNNTVGQTNVPAGLTDVVMIAAGGNHSLALNRNGTVVRWGATSSATQVAQTLSNVVSITVGGAFDLALKSDGTVVVWGGNPSGQTNLPSGLSNVVMLSGGSGHAVALKADGTVIAWGGNDSGQTNVPSGLNNVVAVEAGKPGSFTMALTADGRVIEWGNTRFYGQPPANLTNAVAISGATAGLALTATGTVVSWGSSLWSFPPGLSNVVGIAAGKEDAVALLEDGTVLGVGRLSPPAGLTNVAAVAAGTSHLLALIGDGAPFLTSTFVDRTLPAGRSAAIYASATGAWPLRYQWQHNGIDLPGATNAILNFDSVDPAGAGVYALTISNAFGTVTSREFRVDVTPVLLTAQPQDVGTFVGGAASLSVTALGSPGLRYEWQFQDVPLSGATNASLLLTNLQFSATGEYAVRVTSEFGSVQSATAHIDVSQIAAWGDSSAGQATIPRGLTNVVAMASGEYHNLALRTDGTVVGWPEFNGPADLTNVVAIAAGQAHSLALRADGTVTAWGWNAWGQTNVPPGLSNVISVAAYGWHSLALKGDGTIVSWGYLSNTAPRLRNVVALAGSFSHDLALMADGTVAVWGANTYGKTTLPVGLDRVVAIAAGENHSLALRVDGTVVAWGHGSSQFPSFGQATVPPDLTGVVGIAAFADTSVALRADGSTVVWGEAASGQSNEPPKVASIAAMTRSLALIGVGAPVITSRPIDLTANWASTACLYAQASGTAPLGYQWFYNGAELGGATNVSLVLDDLTADRSGTYSVRVTNGQGSVESTIARLMVALVAEVSPATQTTFVGSTVSLSSPAVGDLSLSYQWRFGGVDIPGATNRTLLLTDIQPEQAGSYSVFVQSPVGSAESLPATVWVSEVVVWGADRQSNVPGDLTNVIAVAAGTEYTLALKADGTVTGWKFAVDTSTEPPVPAGLSNIVSIAAGQLEAMALHADGQVTAWMVSPVSWVETVAGLTNAVAIAVGRGAKIALRNDGRVVQWTKATAPWIVPGLSNVVRVTAAGRILAGLTADGVVVAWDTGQSPPIPVPVLTNAVAISAAPDYGLALRPDGTVVAWNLDGTLRDNTTDGLTNVVMIAAGGALGDSSRFVALRADGKLIAWPESDVPSQLVNVAMIAEGASHSVAIVKAAAPPNQLTLDTLRSSTGSCSFSSLSQSGRVYQPEFKQSLSETGWTPLPLIAGNGSHLTLNMPSLSTPQGYYRLRRW